MKTIYLLSSLFPYRDRGEEFLVSELRCRKFEDQARVSIIPVNLIQETAVKQEIPDDVLLRPLLPGPQKKISKLFNAFAFLFHFEFWQELFMLHQTNRMTKANLYKLLSFGSRSVSLYRRIRKTIIKDDDWHNIIFYSYWMLESAYVAALFSKKYSIPSVSRAHGGDLYEERSSEYIPMRSFTIENLTRVYPVSKKGEEYLTSKYEGIGTICYKHLGSENSSGEHCLKNKNPFRIVSCSSLIPLKRVPLVAKALSLITDIDIEWVHFGDGSERKNVEKIIKNMPNNVRCIMMGNLPLDEVLSYYKENDVHLFVNASTTEGIPMSIIEAMSFGIPIIATDVGGTAEAVSNQENGLLLSPNISESELATAIHYFFDLPDNEYMKYRHSAYETWKRSYCALTNYPSFYKELLELKTT